MNSPPPTSSPLTPLPDEDNLEAVSSSDSGYICPDSEPDRVFERKRLDHLIGQIDAFDDWMFSGDRHGKPVFQPLPPSSPPSAPQQISCPYHRGVGGTPPQHYQQTLATWSPAQPWEEDEGDHGYDPVEVNGYGEPLSSDYPQSYPDDLFGPHEPYAHAVPVALSPSVERKPGFLSTPVTSKPGETTPQRKPRLSAKDVSSPSLSDKASSEHLYNARQDPPSMDATYMFPPSPPRLLGPYHPEAYGAFVNWEEAERGNRDETGSREATPGEEDRRCSVPLPMIRSFEEAQRPPDYTARLQHTHDSETDDHSGDTTVMDPPHCMCRAESLSADDSESCPRPKCFWEMFQEIGGE